MRITAQSHMGNSITTSPCTNEWPCLSLRERAGVRVLRLEKAPQPRPPLGEGEGAHRNQLPVPGSYWSGGFGL